VLEGGAEALAFASGMAATNAVMTLLKSGDHVVVGEGAYGGTPRLFDAVLANFGLEFTYVDSTKTSNISEALRPNTRMVFVETPTNPLMKLTDLAALSAITRPRGLSLVVDNTFLSPYFQKPLKLGADIVVHSTTKYLNGHSDGVGGIAVLAHEEQAARLKFIQNAAGAILGPFDSWLVLRGIKTLALRMDRHGANALVVSRWLEARPEVARVLYPGLPSHPQQGLAARQMRNGGGMVSFELKAGAQAARRLAEAVELFTLAESLGGVESLIEVPAVMTHASTAGSALAVDPSLIRLSVGLETAADLVSDLEQAFERADLP